MMGKRTVAQEALFYEFSLERHVPPDHLYAPSTGSWIYRAFASSCGPSTVRAVARLSIPS